MAHEALPADGTAASDAGGGGGGLPEVWLVMEYCSGGTLGDQLQHGVHLLPGSGRVDMVSRVWIYVANRFTCTLSRDSQAL
jgi:hypothetical protein